MTILFTLILVGTLVIVTVQIVAGASTPKDISATLTSPYISKKPLTPTEISFYQKLIEALPEYIVLAQVQLSSFIKVDRSKLISSRTYAWQNPISQQSVDYLICTKDFSIVAAIELDDKTHLSAKAIKRDDKKTRNLASAKIPLIRWHAELMPSIQTIQQTINSQTATLNEINHGSAWVADELPTFMKPKQTMGFPIRAIGLILLICISIFFIKETVGNFNRNISNITNIKPATTQIEVSTKPSNYELQLQEQREKALLEKQKLEEENKKRILIAQEYAIKEEVWNKHFKNKVECTNSESIVSCGNDYIRNREKFERYWEGNKSRYIDTYVQDQNSN